MTPEERQLVTGLFQRMRSFGAPQKDSEAAALIGEAMRTLPDAPYMLVQSVLAQEHALQEAGKRVEDLERRLREGQTAAQREQQGSGSFLGGLLGGGRPVSPPAAQPTSQANATSVPPTESRAGPAAFDDDHRRPRWTQSASARQAAAEPAPAAGGGFMRSALATAAGVAGGMLAAGAIGNLLGTNSPAQAANAPANPAAKPPAGNDANTDAAVQQARQDWEDDVRADAEDSDWSDGGGVDTGGDF